VIIRAVRLGDRKIVSDGLMRWQAILCQRLGILVIAQAAAARRAVAMSNPRS